MEKYIPLLLGLRIVAWTNPSPWQRAAEKALREVELRKLAWPKNHTAQIVVFHAAAGLSGEDS